jgi:hypothetical protein
MLSTWAVKNCTSKTRMKEQGWVQLNHKLSNRPRNFPQPSSNALATFHLPTIDEATAPTGVTLMTRMPQECKAGRPAYPSRRASLFPANSLHIARHGSLLKLHASNTLVSTTIPLSLVPQSRWPLRPPQPHSQPQTRRRVARAGSVITTAMLTRSWMKKCRCLAHQAIPFRQHTLPTASLCPPLSSPLSDPTSKPATQEQVNTTQFLLANARAPESASLSSSSSSCGRSSCSVPCACSRARVRSAN